MSRDGTVTRASMASVASPPGRPVAALASRRACASGSRRLSPRRASARQLQSVTSGRGRDRRVVSPRCERLDWSDVALGVVRSRGDDDDASSCSSSSLWLPGSCSRRGALLGGSALVASLGAAADPPPARAFIDLPSRLHNRYFLVRHGESTLDTRGLVLSNPSFKYDTTYGLTRTGMAQMHAAAKTIVEVYDGAPSWLYTSNFQRSFQSALIIREDVGMLFSQLRTEFSGLLDPRKMGDLDFKSNESLKQVWEGDLKDPLNPPPPVPASLQPSASVESPRDVYRRALECFTRLEATYYGEDVILVSHQDTLSLFTASLMGTPLTDHHKDWALELGEVRCVDLSAPPQGTTNFSPTDLRGEYAVGDKAVNYMYAKDSP